ncbi:hypothetical protein DFJ74DRAFT_586558, partial [Hyaloraphidium curvatum]
GMVIWNCAAPGTVALTFDDGPWVDTNALLDILDGRGVKATFFMNGANMGNINDRADVVRRMRNGGHCVASHGWAHINMASNTYDAQLSNLVQLDTAMRGIMGARPRFFRPPYGAFNDDTRRAAASLGYDLALWNLDTRDWEVGNADVAFQAYVSAMGAADAGSQAFLALQHDIRPETVYQLAGRAVDYVRSRGFRPVDLGTCLG